MTMGPAGVVIGDGVRMGVGAELRPETMVESIFMALLGGVAAAEPTEMGIPYTVISGEPGARL